jgi:hypothetical protein
MNIQHGAAAGAAFPGAWGRMEEKILEWIPAKPRDWRCFVCPYIARPGTQLPTHAPNSFTEWACGRRLVSFRVQGHFSRPRAFVVLAEICRRTAFHCAPCVCLRPTPLYPPGSAITAVLHMWLQVPTRTLVQIRTHAQKYFLKHQMPSRVQGGTG